MTVDSWLQLCATVNNKFYNKILHENQDHFGFLHVSIKREIRNTLAFDWPTTYGQEERSKRDGSQWEGVMVTAQMRGVKRAKATG